MSPTHFHDSHANTNGGLSTPTLKVNKGSYMINKKSSSSPSSSLTSSSSSSFTSSLGVTGSSKTLHRHPVIIYTHSPKIIHTHPKDFMALVQKLTGFSRSGDDESVTERGKLEKGNDEEMNKNRRIARSDDNESSSVITDENSGSIGDGQVNSCFVPPIFEPPNRYMTNIPAFTPTSADFFCPHQPFYNYTDPLFFSSAPNIRASISSPSTVEGMNE
ncbi:hypothetical protein K2173_028231 [Erythroxylum novogranatense]|uniref:VQ domain-containing protein n=1 Tax=Erythroxylum novogranatense TaxID=1862640 RepID=A0AAV8U4L1_9ROSI|nr:hypothetical protein K2173_028231 [Erythroxylum novogranatense]